MKFNEYVARCQAIAKIGKKYSSDPYALENYEDLEKLSAEMVSELCGTKKMNIYEHDVYPTPSCSVRVIVFNKTGQLLMVQEAQDGLYAVPGGWCEVFDTLQETAIKEVNQETGLNVKVQRLLAIFQRERYKDYPTLLSEQVHYFLAEMVDGKLRPNHEILKVGFYDLDDLPELSKKNSKSELLKALQIAKDGTAVFYD